MWAASRETHGIGSYHYEYYRDSSAAVHASDAIVIGEIIRVGDPEPVPIGEVRNAETGERYLFLLTCNGEAVPCSLINPEQGDMLIVNKLTKRTNNLEVVRGDVKEDRLIEAIEENLAAEGQFP